jgi:hypothetical protein
VGAVAALLFAGCGSPDNADEIAPKVTASAGDAAKEAAYLEALRAIDPALAEDKSAVSSGENICLDVEQGKDGATQAKNAAARFEVDTATGAKIVAAARTTLCK